MKFPFICIAVVCAVTACSRAPETEVPVDDFAAAPVEEPRFRFSNPFARGPADREPDTCMAADYQQFVGATAGAVEAAGIEKPFRVISEGAIITQEFAPERLNFTIGSRGTVKTVTCG